MGCNIFFHDSTKREREREQDKDSKEKERGTGKSGDVVRVKSIVKPRHPLFAHIHDDGFTSLSSVLYCYQMWILPNLLITGWRERQERHGAQEEEEKQ